MHKILIIDDERHATTYLEETLKSCLTLPNNKQLFGSNIFSINRPSEVLQAIKTYNPILIFLDIQMPQKNGLELAEEIENYKEEHNLKFPKIIFTTAYSDFGYQAFKVNAVDYLLKPISEENLNKSLLKFIENSFNDLLKAEHVEYSQNGINTQININDVIYFKSDFKYIIVKTSNKEVLINETLLQLEEKFPYFVKIHRSFLINPLYAKKIHKKDNQYYLILNNDEKLPISRRQTQEVKEKLVMIETIDS